MGIILLLLKRQAPRELILELHRLYQSTSPESTSSARYTSGAHRLWESGSNELETFVRYFVIGIDYGNLLLLNPPAPLGTRSASTLGIIRRATARPTTATSSPATTTPAARCSTALLGYGDGLRLRAGPGEVRVDGLGEAEVLPFSKDVTDLAAGADKMRILRENAGFGGPAEHRQSRRPRRTS